MNTLDLLTELFDHMAWADALTWKGVLAFPAAGEDRVLRERLHHIHLCQHAWLKIWLGKPVDPHDGEEFDLFELAGWARDYHEAVQGYLTTLNESDLARTVIVPETGPEFSQPHLSESFIQITSHSMYHRGQVSARLREIGGAPAQTDFILWVGSGKPEAVWLGD